jgi:hypothetical protein
MKLLACLAAVVVSASAADLRERTGGNGIASEAARALYSSRLRSPSASNPAAL